LKTTFFAFVVLTLRIGLSVYPEKTLSPVIFDLFLSEPTAMLFVGLALIGIANLFLRISFSVPAKPSESEAQTYTA
jgi:hypothetical protein